MFPSSSLVCSFAVGGRGQIEILGVSVLASMETASPCASSGSASHLELSSSDDLPVQQSLLLSDGLEVLLYTPLLPSLRRPRGSSVLKLSLFYLGNSVDTKGVVVDLWNMYCCGQLVRFLGIL